MYRIKNNKFFPHSPIKAERSQSESILGKNRNTVMFENIAVDNPQRKQDTVHICTETHKHGIENGLYIKRKKTDYVPMIPTSFIFIVRGFQPENHPKRWVSCRQNG